VSSRIRNFKRLNERRVVLAIGVVYDTPIETVERLPGMLREIVEATPDARFDRAHFKAFGASALEFEAAYFALKQEYGAMMDIQQAINLAILRRFEREGIAFAFPTQTVRYVNPPNGATGVSRETADALLAQKALQQKKS
jgi:small-conductance mechanosensitive channel